MKVTDIKHFSGGSACISSLKQLRITASPKPLCIKATRDIDSFFAHLGEKCVSKAFTATTEYIRAF